MLNRSTTFRCAVLLAMACGSDTADRAWTTRIDDSGDTVKVHITGGTTAMAASTVVPEVRVGAVDGPAELTFGAISEVMGLATGGLLVHDAQEQLIRLYDANGAFVRNLGGKGSGPGEYGQVNGITQLADGRIFVWDPSNSRVNRYAADGTYEATFRTPGSGWFSQNVLYHDAQDRVLLWTPLPRDTTDWSKGTRTAYTRVSIDGAILDTLQPPDWPSPPMLVAERRESGGGVSRTGAGLPWGASGTSATHPDGGYVTGPGSRYEFSIVRDGQKPITVTRDFTPVPVSDVERREREAQIEFTMRRMDPSWSWTGDRVPATKPAYQMFLIGDDGRIWVRVYTAGVSLTAEEIADLEAARSRRNTAPGMSPPPILTTREPVAYDIYEATGELIGRVELPPRISIRHTHGDVAWGTWRDDDDVSYAVRFRIEPALGGEGDRAARRTLP